VVDDEVIVVMEVRVTTEFRFAVNVPVPSAETVIVIGLSVFDEAETEPEVDHEENI